MSFQMNTKYTFKLLVTLVISTVLFSKPGLAAFPGKNGKILFSHQVGGLRLIQSINPDGTGLQDVASTAREYCFAASWSPNGKQYIFVFVESGRAQTWVANADGTNERNLSNNSFNDWGSGFSPDGSKIIFHSNQEGNDKIYLMNLDGSNRIRLTNTTASNDNFPKFSPDGSKIVFMRDGDIYVMNANGSNPVNLTNTGERDDIPDWSPDGTKITFHDQYANIVVMNADGSNRINLATGSAARWSPDGTKIAFESGNDQGGVSIYTIDINGNNLYKVTSGGGGVDDRGPVWQSIPTTVNAATPLLSLGDINKDNSPEIAVVTYNPTLKKSTATVKNAQTGGLVQQIILDRRFIPTKANVLPDLNGNGAPEIAVLGVRSSDQAVQVEVRDSLSGVKLSAVPFDSIFNPLDLGVVRDISGKGTAGLAVLQQSDTELRVQLKNALSGVQIGNISFSAGYKGIDLLVLGDLNGNRTKEIAVLADKKTATAADTVEIRDSKTGVLIRSISYGIGKDLQQLINLPDMNNSGGAELAVLRANTARVLVKDAKTGLPVNTLDYAVSQPFRLATAADSNSQTNLAMLGVRAATGQPRADVHAPLSDTFINKVIYDNYGTTVGFISIPDINGNGVAELVRLREQPGPQKLFAEVRDGRTGVLIQGMYF